VPAPDDRLDIMEAKDHADSSKDARLEDQRVLGVSVALKNPDPEVWQRLQKGICPLAVGEVIQLQVASSNPEVEPLPFGILSDTNPTVEVGAIIVLMDDVAVDTEEPMSVGVGASLQAQVLLDKLRIIHAEAEHKVATHMLLGPTGHPNRVCRHTNGDVQVGVCNGRRQASGANIRACLSPQVPAAQPSAQTAMPAMAINAAAAVCAVSATVRKGEDVRAC